MATTSETPRRAQPREAREEEAITVLSGVYGYRTGDCRRQWKAKSSGLKGQSVCRGEACGGPLLCAVTEVINVTGPNGASLSARCVPTGPNGGSLSSTCVPTGPNDSSLSSRCVPTGPNGASH